MAEAQIILDALADWVGHQRWFVGKGTMPSLRCVASLTLSSDPQFEVKILIAGDQRGADERLFQVPVVLRRAFREAGAPGHIGSLRDPDGLEWQLYDGPEDPAFTERLLRLIADGESLGDDTAAVRGIPTSPWPSSNLTSRVLRGEQSNTSIVYSAEDDSTGESSVICKIFRMLHHGENPDVVLQSALFTSGSTSVPPLFGSVAARWPDDSRPDGSASGHLAFAQRFLSGAQDAWSLALAAGSTHADFTVSARQIGIATADVHATLARALPTRDPAAADIEVAVAAWRTRLDAAIAEVPELTPLRPAIELLYERAAGVPWPKLQSIHGDLHLGQILATPSGSWAIIDFEGEPMRPLDERSLPDLPLRDIAGMLRSFDYAAGSHEPSESMTRWAHECRVAFIDGYIAGSGRDVRKNRVLLDAFEMDKALYEVVYEANNRPAWLGIPTSAVQRLADRAATAR